MKFPQRILAALLPIPTALVCLSACAAPFAVGQETPTETAAESTDIRAHYDALVTTLLDRLDTLRADTAATTETLLARIQALEAALESLDIPLPSPPPTTASTDTSAESPPADGTDALPDTIASPPETIRPPETDETEPPREAVGFRYTIRDGAATITGYGGDLTDTRLIIPSTLDDCPVTRIADRAFEGAPLTSVTLPATLTHIGWFAFSGCPRLCTVTIPASVEHIDYGAFDACPNLLILCPAASYAARYAAASALPHVEV